jgi:hypothetical protein
MNIGLIVGVIAAAFVGIYAVRQYYNGTMCRVRRDLTGQVAVITGGNTGIGR